MRREAPRTAWHVNTSSAIFFQAFCLVLQGLHQKGQSAQEHLRNRRTDKSQRVFDHDKQQKYVQAGALAECLHVSPDLNRD